VLWRVGRYPALLSGGQIMRRIQRGAMGLRDAEGGAIFTFAEVPRRWLRRCMWYTPARRTSTHTPRDDVDDKVCHPTARSATLVLYSLDAGPCPTEKHGCMGRAACSGDQKQMYELFASSVCSPACGSLSSNKKEHGVALTDSYDAHAASC
jgi:hypothetical protein